MSADPRRAAGRLGWSTVALAAITAALACSTNVLPEDHPNTPGWPCETSSDCNSGLSCEPIGTQEGSSCTVLQRECAVKCTADADCKPLGATFACQSTCGGKYICASPCGDWCGH